MKIKRFFAGAVFALLLLFAQACELLEAFEDCGSKTNDNLKSMSACQDWCDKQGCTSGGWNATLKSCKCR